MCIHDCPVPIYQDESELARLRELVRAVQPARILEIGSLFGGTLWYWMQDNPGVTVVSVDLGVQSFDYRFSEVEAARAFLWPVWERATGSRLVQIRADSTSPATVAEAASYGPYDFIFIDGGHWYEVAKADFENYWPLLRAGGLLAFHDTAYPEGNPDNYGVGRVWREVRERGAAWQDILRTHNPEGIWGIGAMWKEAE